MMLSISHAELATLRAALQMYRDAGGGDPSKRSDDIHDLATDGDAVMYSLDDAGVDELDRRLQQALRVCRTQGDAEPVQPDRRAQAEQAFIDFDFGEGVQVIHHNGWEVDGDRWSKAVFVELPGDGPDDPTHDVTFRVQFDTAGRLVEVSAQPRDFAVEKGLCTSACMERSN